MCKSVCQPWSKPIIAVHGHRTPKDKTEQLILNKLIILISDKQNCSRDHTLLFVAFDLQETQRTGCSGKCSCPGALCGSGNFVQNLIQYLNNTGAGFQGAVILETVLNYNDTPNTQTLPWGFSVGFPKQYQQLSQNQFRGDFLAVIGRAPDDAQLVSGITNAFKKNG